MSYDIALNDIQTVIVRGTMDICDSIGSVCETIRKTTPNDGARVLDFVLGNCCRQATDAQGDRIDGGYIAERGISIRMAGNAQEVAVAVGDELFVKDGVVRIMDSRLHMVSEVVITCIQSLRYGVGASIEHPWDWK